MEYTHGVYTGDEYDEQTKGLLFEKTGEFRAPTYGDYFLAKHAPVVLYYASRIDLRGDDSDHARYIMRMIPASKAEEEG